MNRSVRRDVHWLAEEDDRLLKMVKSGLNATEIAEQLNRTSAAIRGRALRLGIPLAKSRRLRVQASK